MRHMALQWRPSPIVRQHTIPYLWNIHGIGKYTTDEPYSPFSPLSEPTSDLQEHISYPCYNTLLSLSSTGAYIEYKLRKLLQIRFVGSSFFNELWKCRDDFLLVAPVFPSTPNYVFEIIYTTLLKLRKDTLNPTSNTGGSQHHRMPWQWQVIIKLHIPRFSSLISKHRNL